MVSQREPRRYVELPVPICDARAMPVDVRAVLWEPLVPGMPLSDHGWRMYELPEAGAHYWHGTTGYRLDRIERMDDETRVHLVRDPEWEQEMSIGLPDDYLVDGGRDSERGEWHFHVVGPQGRVAGGAWAFGDDLERTIRQAVAGAVHELANLGGA